MISGIDTISLKETYLNKDNIIYLTSQDESSIRRRIIDDKSNQSYHGYEIETADMNEYSQNQLPGTKSIG